MTHKNSTQNNNLILDCISQSIGIEAPTAFSLGANPFLYGVSNFASCTIRSSGKSFINEYMFEQNKHPYWFKMSAMMLGCTGGAVKYSLTGYNLASNPGVFKAFVITGCINNALYELVSDLDEKYAFPIPIEFFETIIRPKLTKYFDASFNNFGAISDHTAGLTVFVTSQIFYPIVKDWIDKYIDS